MSDFDSYYSEQFTELRNEIEIVKKIAKDGVAKKEKELQAQMDKSVNSIRKFVDSNIDDMVNERRETLERYEKQFDSIKMVSCKYFEKYDIELEAISLKIQNVMDKYTDWSKVLIEPASMNDARLFSLESRVH